MFILRYILNIFFTCSKIEGLRRFLSVALSGISLHTFVENGISKDEKKLFQLLSKKAGVLNLFRMDLFGAVHRWRRKVPLPKICQTYPTMMKLGTLITYLKKIKKMYKSHETQPLNSADISIFLPEIRNFWHIKKYR